MPHKTKLFHQSLASKKLEISASLALDLVSVCLVFIRKDDIRHIPETLNFHLSLLQDTTHTNELSTLNCPFLKLFHKTKLII